MSTLKQTLVEYTNVVQKSKGTSNSANLRAMFPNSPIYTNDDPISDDERLETYQALLDAEGVTGYGVVNFSMNYSNAPELQDVETGGEGKPATPFSPNPSSPGPGSHLAADQPEFQGTVKDIETVSNFGTGLGGLTSPASTTNSISKTKIGEYVSGRSYQGSDGRS